MQDKKINILDCTLRDGSYAIDFSFSAHDTALICSELESVGFEYIEIGHGVGLNGSEKHRQALETDEAYMVAAAESLTTAKYGMFCIPGVARLEDVDKAIEHNMGFIRIGTDVADVERSRPFIEKAKKAGMFVAANYMKSYASSPEYFAKQVKLSESYGADLVYIVDSAGGMFPEDIKKYYHAIKEVSDIAIGFHGHDNLHLAIANSLTAIDLGFDFVDTSLQGLGRSSGNATTEILLTILEKRGIETGIDFFRTLGIGEKYIAPLIRSKGVAALDTICGYADFHSSYMSLIHKYAAKYSVNPLLLIIEITKINKIDVDENILDEIAQKLKKEEIFIGRYRFDKYIGNEQKNR